MMKFNFLNKLVIFCLSLVVIRFLKTGHYTFIFLIWNLFLAWIPLYIIRKSGQRGSRILNMACLLTAILFLPNAPYLLTDLFHLKKELAAPLWFDLIMILSFAFAGIIYFMLALDMILEKISVTFGKAVAFAKPLLLLATAYGIYLGRFLRYNSWDLLLRPLKLAGGMFHSIFSGGNYKETLSVTITFAVFLYLIFEIYLSFKNKIALNKNELH